MKSHLLVFVGPVHKEPRNDFANKDAPDTDEGHLERLPGDHFSLHQFMDKVRIEEHLSESDAMNRNILELE
jgi:hypothetical protein